MGAVRGIEGDCGRDGKAGMEDWAKEIFDQALKVAEEIEDARGSGRGIGEIAGEMAKAGMVERMEEVFDQALKAAEGIETTWWRSKVKDKGKEGLGEIAEEIETDMVAVRGIKGDCRKKWRRQGCLTKP
jgi:hypothetical protein